MLATLLLKLNIYSRSSRFVIFIANDRSNITDLSLKIRCKLINSMPLFMNGI